MSSNYAAICLDHTPALRIDNEHWDSDRTAETAIRTAQSRPHRYCQLMIGRWSGALVEIGCPAGCRLHFRDIRWMDVQWLKLGALALDIETPELANAFRQLPWCFRGERLRKLRQLLIEGTT